MAITCLVGESGSGKDTILKEMIKMGYEGIVSYTSRDIRPNEINHVDYHFITEDKFLELIEQDFFAECTEYNMKIQGIRHYGIANEDCIDGKVVVVNPIGVKQLIESLGRDNLIIVYVKVSEDVRRERTIKRGDNQEEINGRSERDKRDFEGFENICDFVFENTYGTIRELSEAVREFF